ncbi:aspartate dehydrogenase [Amorphus sp. 3PC139-8]|uniref:aspartate dehydrogenase n=1 Tax=Amorphus sp. 3PC139-8 TaxID=2735676 RepID=UPI00345D075F
MPARRLGIIGYGAIGQAIVERLRLEGTFDDLACVLIRPGRKPADDLPLFDDLADFLSSGPDVVIEAAGQRALTHIGPAVAAAGIDLVASSVGALMDKTLMATLLGKDDTAPGKVLIPSGAIAGLDGLVAARLAGLDEVRYTSHKPPHAWLGTAAEGTLDFDHIEDEVVFFEGTARDAAVRFPKNANVSAAIALAGIGPERTQVRLVSSRRVTDPLGVVEASGAFGWFRFEIYAHAFPSNPKSSMLTAYSLLECARYGIGMPLAAVACSSGDDPRHASRNTVNQPLHFVPMAGLSTVGERKTRQE